MAHGKAVSDVTMGLLLLLIYVTFQALSFPGTYRRPRALRAGAADP